MSIREYWVIRHKPSGGYLPILPSGLRAGYTHTEPDTQAIPRLFTDAAAAKRALTWWLKGITHVDHSKSIDTWMGPGEYEETWGLDEMPERKLEDMEVLPCLLKL